MTCFFAAGAKESLQCDQTLQAASIEALAGRHDGSGESAWIDLAPAVRVRFAGLGPGDWWAGPVLAQFTSGCGCEREA